MSEVSPEAVLRAFVEMAKEHELTLPQVVVYVTAIYYEGDPSLYDLPPTELTPEEADDGFEAAVHLAAEWRPQSLAFATIRACHREGFTPNQAAALLMNTLAQVLPDTK